MLLLLYGVPAVAATPTVSTDSLFPHVYTKDELVAKVITEADANGINSAHMVAVIDCETAHTWDPTIQSTLYNAKDPGHREDSWGLAQIHLPDHIKVSQTQATDPNFAIKWMAEEWKAGNYREWSCYQIEMDKGWQD